MEVVAAEFLVAEARGLEQRAAYLRELVQQNHATTRKAIEALPEASAEKLTAAVATLSLNDGNKFHVAFTHELALVLARMAALEVICGIRRGEVRESQPADGAPRG